MTDKTSRVERGYLITDEYDDTIGLTYQEAWTIVGVFERGPLAHTPPGAYRSHGDLVTRWLGADLCVSRRCSDDSDIYVPVETAAELRAELVADFRPPPAVMPAGVVPDVSWVEHAAEVERLASLARKLPVEEFINERAEEHFVRTRACPTTARLGTAVLDKLAITYATVCARAGRVHGPLDLPHPPPTSFMTQVGLVALVLDETLAPDEVVIE